MIRGLILMLACSTAHAEFMDGNELLSRLRGEGSRYFAGIGYVMGVFDSFQGGSHCPPANVTAGQVTDMVRNHLEASPELRHLSADRHVNYILKKTWPCPERRGGAGV